MGETKIQRTNGQDKKRMKWRARETTGERDSLDSADREEKQQRLDKKPPFISPYLPQNKKRFVSMGLGGHMSERTQQTICINFALTHSLTPLSPSLSPSPSPSPSPSTTASANPHAKQAISSQKFDRRFPRINCPNV